MHRNSMIIMRAFFRDYVPDKKLKVLDVGSRMLEHQTKLGCYKDLIKDNQEYIGLDIEKGLNVDKIYNGKKFPFRNNSFDIVISGQTFEHIERPWETIKEIQRVLKKGGICCIIAPAMAYKHSNPLDTFRYMPDAWASLAKWAKLKPLKIRRKIKNSRYQDSYLIAKK